MSAAVRRTSVEGFDALVLENAHLRAVIVPALGGRVWQLEDRQRGRQWIWHREDVPLAVVAPGAPYDEVWAGGWEELFPNDAPGRFEGRDLPDHGEWWTMAWEAGAVEQGATAAVTLTATSRVVKARCTKEFRLAGGEPRLAVRYRIRSQEPEPFHYLFKQHLPVRITPACRLWLPGGTVHVVDPTFGTVLPGAGPFTWPVAGRGETAVDLRRVPPREEAAREFVYVSNLDGAWCGVEDGEAGASIRMDFDTGAFPYLWLFLSYGGWRNVYTAVLEPCTNMPKDLGEAVRLGQSARLEPDGTFETTVTVSLGGLEAPR